MSTTTRKQITDLFTILVVILTTIQGLIPAMPLTNEHTITLVSAILIFLVSGITAWKQYLSSEIDTSALKPTLFIAIVATLGGLNDLFNVIPMNDVTAQWLRFGVTALTAAINLASKVLFPTPATKTAI
jgi:hypothetical protein